MRELMSDECNAVSGGFGFVDAVATGSAIGAASYGGLTMAAGYAMETVTASFGAGGAIGGVLGGIGFLGYYCATAAGAGTLGGELGTDLALAMSD